MRKSHPHRTARSRGVGQEPGDKTAPQKSSLGKWQGDDLKKTWNEFQSGETKRDGGGKRPKKKKRNKGEKRKGINATIGKKIPLHSGSRLSSKKK